MAALADVALTTMKVDSNLVADGFVESVVAERPCKLYYQLHSNCKGQSTASVKVLLVHGLACSCAAWEHQLEDLFADKSVAVEVCIFDHRGIGKSDRPTSKLEYSTAIMAQDILNLLEHLQWEAVHLAGFSMGAMTAAKAALAAPHRILSLSLMAISGGGLLSLPTTFRGWKYGIRGALAKTPAQKALVDVKFHFSRTTLRQRVLSSNTRRKEELLAEYTRYHAEGDGEVHGIKGQMHACWSHKLRGQEVEKLNSAAFPILVLHGRYDLIASVRYAEKLASRLGATCVVLDAAHFIPRECRREVNKLLLEMIRPVQHAPLFCLSSSRHFS